MSNQYVGEIRLFPYMRGAPDSWQLCDGSLLQIAENEVLYTVIGTTYGGDGQSTFAVPDLRGRVPIHQGTGLGLSTYTLGQTGGTEEVTLTTNQMASHFHMIMASTAAGTSGSPANNIPATVAGEPFYTPVVQGTTSPYPLPGNTIGIAGSSGGHENTAPTLTLNYCIALYGVFPSQS